MGEPLQFTDFLKKTKVNEMGNLTLQKWFSQLFFFIFKIMILKIAGVNKEWREKYPSFCYFLYN